jgi:hypothetical protein
MSQAPKNKVPPPLPPSRPPAMAAPQAPPCTQAQAQHHHLSTATQGVAGTKDVGGQGGVVGAKGAGQEEQERGLAQHTVHTHDDLNLMKQRRREVFTFPPTPPPLSAARHRLGFGLGCKAPRGLEG